MKKGNIMDELLIKDHHHHHTKHTIRLISFLVLLAVPVYANDLKSEVFDDYLRNFDNRERIDMKIRIPLLIDLYKQNKIQIIDIRTPEEHQAYHLALMKHIPINELPERLNELDRNKIIITVCSNYVRAAIARTYLVLNGFNSKYLVDGISALPNI